MTRPIITSGRTRAAAVAVVVGLAVMSSLALASQSGAGGGQIAMTVFEPGPNGKAAIHLVHGDGRLGRKVASRAGGDLTWSPDGRKLAWREARGTYGPYALMAADRTGRNAHTLALVRCCNIGLSGPSWSPDSRRIAYVRGIRERVAGRTLRTGRPFVARADGSGERGIVLHEPGEPRWEHSDRVWDVGRAAWSPNGDSIAVAAYRRDGECFGSSCDPWRPAGSEPRIGIWLLDPSSGELRSLLRGQVGSPVWSPDGSRIAFVDAEHASARSPDGDLRVLRLTTGAVTRVASSPLGGAPVWAPDGRRLAGWVTTGRRDRTVTLRVVRADGSGGYDPTRGTPNEHVEMVPQWSPDGRRLLFSRVRILYGRQPPGTKNPVPHVYVVNSRGGTARRFTTLDRGEGSVAWSRR